jgi:hypothetical protein
VALFSAGSLYTRKDFEQARAEGYQDGFADGFRKTRAVEISVSGHAYADPIDDYVDISESCTVEISGDEAEGDCEF